MEQTPSSPSFQPRSALMAQYNSKHESPYVDHRQPSPTPRTRSSTESSATKASGLRRSSLQDSSADGPDEVVPTSFDESALRVLIDMDVRLQPSSSTIDYRLVANSPSFAYVQCGVNCLLDRIKQGMASARVSSPSP